MKDKNEESMVFLIYRNNFGYETEAKTCFKIENSIKIKMNHVGEYIG